MTLINKNLNEKGYALHASILPLLIIVAIIAGAGYYLMKGEFSLPSMGKKRTEVRRIDGFPTVAYTNDQVEKQRVVIKSNEELNAFLNKIDASGQLVLPENIDFEKEYLLGVATETLTTNGYKIRVNKVYEDKEKSTLIVSAEETRPGEKCQVDVQNNVAVDIVAITATDWNIDFERIAKTDECE